MIPGTNGISTHDTRHQWDQHTLYQAPMGSAHIIPGTNGISTHDTRHQWDQHT